MTIIEKINSIDVCRRVALLASIKKDFRTVKQDGIIVEDYSSDFTLYQELLGMVGLDSHNIYREFKITPNVNYGVVVQILLKESLKEFNITIK